MEQAPGKTGQKSRFPLRPKLLLLDWQGTFCFPGFICLALALPALYFTLGFKERFVTDEGQIDEKKGKNGVYQDVIGNPLIWLLILALSANARVTQTVTVDMPVNLHPGQIARTQGGSLMPAISLVMIISSVGAERFPISSRTVPSIRYGPGER
jgi:hypothetical protein